MYFFAKNENESFTFLNFQQESSNSLCVFLDSGVMLFHKLVLEEVKLNSIEKVLRNQVLATVKIVEYKVGGIFNINSS